MPAQGEEELQTNYSTDDLVEPAKESADLIMSQRIVSSRAPDIRYNNNHMPKAPVVAVESTHLKAKNYAPMATDELILSPVLKPTRPARADYEPPAAPVEKRNSYSRSARLAVGLAMLRPQPPSKKTKVTNASTVIEETHRDGREDGGIKSENEIQSKVPVESVPSFYSNEVYLKLSKANSKMCVAKTWPFTYL